MNFNSLSMRTLRKMSLRIAVVIVTVTTISYLHLEWTIESQTKQTLSSYNGERQELEKIIFNEAHDNHKILMGEFLKLYKKNLTLPNLEGRYQSLVETNADGATRNRRTGYDGKQISGIFNNSKEKPGKRIMAKLLAAYDISNQMGPAYHARFQDTYFTFPENAIVLYWPEEPEWVFKAKSTYNVTAEEYANVSMPEHNPEKETRWTGLFYDKVSDAWMVTGSSPIYDDQEFLGSVHHDVMVSEIVNRTLKKNLKGAKNYIVREDGRLIAHPDYLTEIQKQDGFYDLKNSKDEILRSQFNTIKGVQTNTVLADEKDNFLAVAKIEGPDWYLVSTYPKSLIRRAAAENVGVLLGAAVLSLVLELLILFTVLYREVSKPLFSLIQGTRQVTQGNYDVNLVDFEKRKDELGELAFSFNEMTKAINVRDKLLARHNEDLESLVDQRTRELDEQKQLNIQASKLSALGEMAGGIAHEVNTPLATIKLLSSQAINEVVEDIPDMEKIGLSLSEIDKTVDRAAKIIRGLKSFSRNASEDPFEEVDLNTVLEDTISLCQEKCRVHGIELKVSAFNGPAFVAGRAAQLGQVLLNLINNAHDAVENQDSKWISVRITEGNDSYQIEVSDSGSGIPENIKEKIFNPFFTTKDVGKGTGLGLSISHGIIKTHNGALKLKENSAQTVFVVTLPKMLQVRSA